MGNSRGRHHRDHRLVKPKYPTSAGTERELLEKHLEHNRKTVLHKVDGLSHELAIKRLGNTPTSVAGIVKHLTEVERWWFRYYLDGQDWIGSSTDENPDAEFDVLDGEAIKSLTADFERACAESREVAVKYELGDETKRARNDGQHPSLRWIYLHMIEEVARHNGHIDIYRELLDGVTDREI
jgi:uncharacterized damage-inducible protein DinB